MAKIRIDKDKKIVIKPNHVFVYGYYKVNGCRSEYFAIEEEIHKDEIEALRQKKMEEHFTVADIEKGDYDINLLIHKRP